MSPRDEDPILPGEPTFTLRGNDQLAGFLVSIWASAHMGDSYAVAAKISAMLDRFTPGLDSPGYEATADAIDVAMAMFAWRKARDATSTVNADDTPTTKGSDNEEGPSCGR